MRKLIGNFRLLSVGMGVSLHLRAFFISHYILEKRNHDT